MEFLICILGLSFLYLMASSSRVSPHGLEHKPPKHFNIDIVKTVVVGQSGDFKTIQSAIDSIPSGNNNWIKIQLQNGIYFEKIVISREKQKIIMQGSNPSEVIIEYNDAGLANTSGPISVNAEYFVAINVTFKNSYNDIISLVPYKKIKVAPAIILTADKASFYGCRFISVQDTLADFAGRHYFKNCYIEGAIDFIWGGGQSIYEKCVIYVKGVTNEMVQSVATLPGYITAQGRQSEQDTSGFVFKYRVIKGDGTASLGRAYRSYSRVVFYATSMSKSIVPLGWDAWSYKGHEDKITFAEVKCRGEGANTQRRVEWKKNSSKRELAFLINPKTFIDGDGWMATLPSSLVSLLSASSI